MSKIEPKARKQGIADSDQRVEGKGIRVGRRGRDYLRDMYE